MNLGKIRDTVTVIAYSIHKYHGYSFVGLPFLENIDQTRQNLPEKLRDTLRDRTSMFFEKIGDGTSIKI